MLQPPCIARRILERNILPSPSCVCSSDIRQSLPRDLAHFYAARASEKPIATKTIPGTTKPLSHHCCCRTGLARVEGSAGQRFLQSAPRR